MTPLPATRLPALQQVNLEADERQRFAPDVELSGVYRGPVDGFISFCSEQGVTVVIPAYEPEAVVSVKWRAVPAGDALRTVALQIGVEAEVVQRDDTVYLLGIPSSDDMLAQVFHVSGEAASQFESAVRALMSSYGNVASVGDTIVVQDTPAAVGRVNRLFSALTGGRGQWLVEVRFVEVSRKGAERIGLDWDVVGSIDLGALAGGGASALTGMGALQVAAMLEASESDRDLNLITMARLHVIEGEDALLQVGETTPIAQRTISDQGTVSTTGYDNIDTGLLLRVGVRSERNGMLRVHLNPELSEVTGFVDAAPIRSRQLIDTSAVVHPGGVVVVGGFSKSRNVAEHRGAVGLLLHRLREVEEARLFVVLRIVDPSLIIDGD